MFFLYTEEMPTSVLRYAAGWTAIQLSLPLTLWSLPFRRLDLKDRMFIGFLSWCLLALMHLLGHQGVETLWKGVSPDVLSPWLSAPWCRFIVFHSGLLILGVSQLVLLFGLAIGGLEVCARIQEVYRDWRFERALRTPKRSGNCNSPFYISWQNCQNCPVLEEDDDDGEDL